MQISPGAVVAGRYRADRKIGSGSMGEVWAGENVAVGYKVAIKTMLEATRVDPEVVVRFRREALILGKIRSDYVARVLDFASDNQYGLVLILDLIEGDPFSNVLKRTKLTVEEAIEVGCDVVSGLVDLHRANIVHRDLKPSNVILEPRPDGTQRAVIVDLGVSRLMKTADDDEEITNITRADMALGTLEYMAPEQMLDSRGVTGASDVYAVGAMLYRAVAGKHAFGDLQDIDLARMKLLNDTPPLNTGRTDPIGKGFAAVLAKALKRRPAERYKRSEEMLKHLLSLREQVRRRFGSTARSMPSLIDDELVETITQAATVDFDADETMDAEPARGSAPEPARGSAPSQSPPTSKPARGSSPSAPATPSAPPTPSTPPTPSAALPAQSLETMDLEPPPRRGVSPVFVTLLVIGTLAGGIAIGATMFVPPTPDPVFNVSAPPPDPVAPSAVPGAASAPSATPLVGGADASADAALDASRDAASDAAALDAAVPLDGSVPPGGSAPKPFIQPAPPRPGGPLPGAPGALPTQPGPTPPPRPIPSQ